MQIVFSVVVLSDFRCSKINMEVITPSQYFEQHSRHCPLLQAFNGLRFPLRRPSRKVLLRLVLFLLLICVLCNFYDWVKDGKVKGECIIIFLFTSHVVWG